MATISSDDEYEESLDSAETPLIKKECNNIDPELTGCGATIICDPRRNIHKYMVLILICFLSFGSYFVYDNPAALQGHIKQDMGVTTGKFMNLYAWYSWPNVVLCFFGGFLLDRVFGIRLGTILFSSFVVLGQCVFALGAQLDSFPAMEAGRFIFGLGGENLAVAQNTYSIIWFKGGKELNTVFGLQLSFSRVGSTVNMNIMGPLYDFLGEKLGLTGYKCLGATLWFGAIVCVLSLFCAIYLAYLDKRASKILKKGDGQTGEVIRIRDIKDFPAELWLIFIICVAYYVTIFPFIDLGVLFFQDKYDFSQTSANAVNSLVYIISAVASPVFGILVDRTGKNVFWVILGIIITLGSHLLLAFTFLNPYYPMAMMGLSYSLVACALWPLVAFVVPENQLGTAYGCMQSIQNLGLALVAIFAGKIVDEKGYLVLEVFFLVWLCASLIACTLLYIVDAAKDGSLNLSANQRNKLAQDVDKKEIQQPSTSEDENYSEHRIVPSTANALRNRYLSRIGTKLPEHINLSSHLSTLSRRSVQQ